MFTMAGRIAAKKVAMLHATTRPFSAVAAIAADFKSGKPSYDIVGETVEYLKKNPELIPGYAIYPIELLLNPNEKRYIEDLQYHLAKCYAKLEGFFGVDPTNQPIFLWAFDALLGLKAVLEEKDAQAEPFKKEANKILQEMSSRFKALPDEGKFLKLKTQAFRLMREYKSHLSPAAGFEPLV